jgi:hypothetical protein
MNRAKDMLGVLRAHAATRQRTQTVRWLLALSGPSANRDTNAALLKTLFRQPAVFRGIVKDLLDQGDRGDILGYVTALQVAAVVRELPRFDDALVNADKIVEHLCKRYRIGDCDRLAFGRVEVSLLRAAIEDHNVRAIELLLPMLPKNWASFRLDWSRTARDVEEWADFLAPFSARAVLLETIMEENYLNNLDFHPEFDGEHVEQPMSHRGSWLLNRAYYFARPDLWAFNRNMAITDWYGHDPVLVETVRILFLYFSPQESVKPAVRDEITRFLGTRELDE